MDADGQKRRWISVSTHLFAECTANTNHLFPFVFIMVSAASDGREAVEETRSALSRMRREMRCDWKDRESGGKGRQK